MFVGEAPGADEDIQGEPFVGRAGQLLTKIIEAMGYTRKSHRRVTVWVAVLGAASRVCFPRGRGNPTRARNPRAA